MFLIFFKLFFNVAHLENYLNSSLSPCTRYFVTWFCLLDVILSGSCLASFCSLGDFLNCRLNGLSASFTLVDVYGKSTAPFLSCLAKKLVDISGDPMEGQWLHQRLSLTMVRGNTASILACVQVWSGFSHPQCINQCSCQSLASRQWIAIAFRMSVFSVSFIVFSMFF